MKNEKLIIEYYGYFIGEQYIKLISISYLKIRLQLFKSARRKLIAKLNLIKRVYKYDNDISFIDYHKGVGYDHVYNRCFKNGYLDKNTFDYIDILLNPLYEIDREHCKNKIHVLETELCYLNHNIKVLNKAIRERREE